MPSVRFQLVAAFALILVPALAAGNGWEHGAIPFEALRWALGFPEPETRRRAAESLGWRGQREAVEPLLARLALEDNPHVRSAVYLALGRLRDRRALSALVRCLDAEARDELRTDCVTALGLVGDTSAVPRLVRLLEHDSSRLVKHRVIDALGSLPDPTGIEALTALVRGDRDEDLRLRAVRALGRTRAPPASPLILEVLSTARTDAERLAAVEALTELRPPEATAPLTALLPRTGNQELRARVVIALGAIKDDDVLPVLTTLLGDGVPAVRYFAVQGLWRLGRAVAAAPIAGLANDIGRHLRSRPLAENLRDVDAVLADLSVLELAVRALGELDPSGAMAALLETARPYPVPRDSPEALRLAEGVFETRRSAIVALGYTRSRRAAVFLAGPGGLRDPDFRLRAAAVRALGVLGFDDASLRVRQALADPVAEARWTAAVVLGRLGRRESVEPLLRSLRDTHAEVRRQATLSLGYLGDRRARATLRALAARDPDAGVREAAAYAAGLLEAPHF